jgi:hypothetical protein
MSTPIVHYPDDHRIINRDALYLFLAIALPLLVLTVAVWLGLYWHKKRAEERTAYFEKRRREIQP